MEQEPPLSARRIIIGLVGLVVCGLVWLQFGREDSGPSQRTISGRVTSLDVAARAASLEFVHPRSGHAFEVGGHIPVDCDIRIDGKPAHLDDVVVGDTAEVVATIGPRKEITANRIRIIREPAMTTLPTSEPATR